MNCEFTRCIYNRQQKCIVDDDVQIDQLGMCGGCIVVSIDEDYLERAKEEELEKIEARWEASMQGKPPI